MYNDNNIKIKIISNIYISSILELNNFKIDNIYNNIIF